MFDNSKIAYRDCVLDISNMADARNSGLYDDLLALKPQGMSMNEWAVKAGVGRSIFADIRRHGNPTRETLDKLLRAIGVNRSAFEASRQSVRTEVVSDPAQVSSPGLQDLPMLGVAAGSEWGDIDDDIEMIEVNLGEVLYYVARPESMADDRKAYGLTIVGVSMAPRFKPSERVAVSPRAPVAIGDDVIVQLRSPEGDEDRVRMVLIKELLKVGPSYIELRQYNPEMTFRIDRGRVAAMHKVMGRIF